MEEQTKCCVEENEFRIPEFFNTAIRVGRIAPPDFAEEMNKINPFREKQGITTAKLTMRRGGKHPESFFLEKHRRAAGAKAAAAAAKLDTREPRSQPSPIAASENPPRETIPQSVLE